MLLMFKIEKLEIATYRGNNVLSKKTELITKCRQGSKYALSKYDTKDWHQMYCKKPLSVIETRIHNHLVGKGTLHGWVFVYNLSGCGFESSCSHLSLRFRACFEQGVPWHSGNCRVCIQSETHTWHDKNIHSNHYLVAFNH